MMVSMQRKKTDQNNMRIFIFLVLVVLSCSGYLQYHWFNRAARAEIDKTRRRIEFTVSRTALREFQRYETMIKSLGPQESAENPSVDEIRRSLERAWLVYGPEGSLGGFIDGVAYGENDLTGGIYLYDPSEKIWKKQASDLVAVLPPPAREVLRQGTVHFIIPREGLFSDVPVLIIPDGREGSTLFLAAVDTEAFFHTYVKPAVEYTYPEFIFEWNPVSQEPEQSAGHIQNPVRPDNGDENFRPFRSLFGLNNGKPSITVKIPSFVLFFSDKTRDNEGTGPDIGFRMRSEPPEGDRQDKRMFTEVRISSPSGSVYGTVERSLALNWLLGMFLLAGVGAGFIFTILRSYSLRELRNREREFVASVTHELRTPVTVIQSAADNLQSGIISADRIMKYGHLIQNHTRRLGVMIEEILRYSHLEGRGLQEPVLVSVDLHEFFRDLQAGLDHPAREKKLSISWDYSALPGRACVNPEGLRLILENLVTNAVRHAYSTEEGGMIRVLARVSLPHTLLFIVEDDGRGISRRELKRIFEPFFRDVVSYEKQEPGSGLGLFLSEKESRRMNGNLRVESPYERINGEKAPGCRFVLKIPYLTADESSCRGREE